MRIFYLLFIVGLCFSCKQDPSSGFVERDLMSNGIPIKIKAPPEAEVKMEDYGFLKDVTVKKGEDFYIQIIESDASNYDVKALKQESLDEVKTAAFFSQILSEEEQGFIYEKKIDEETYNYDFRYIKIQGDKVYTFQRGLIGTFTQEQVEMMYNAVK
jgi:hypothetical protein